MKRKRNLYDDMDMLKKLTKYGVIGMMVLMVLHCALLLMGYDVLLLHAVLCLFALALGVYLNRIFQLCAVHRCCVYYVITMLSCIIMKRHGVFEWMGIDLDIARWVMLSIGMVLVGLIIMKKCDGKRPG